MDLLAATAEATASLQECPANQQLVQRTLEANRQHQYNLTKYAERLTAQIAKLDKYLEDARLQDDEEEDLGKGPSNIVIPGSKRAAGPVSSVDLLSTACPFYEAANHRMQRISQLSASNMKPKELQGLETAVKAERIRYNALNSESQSSLEISDANLNWDMIAEKVSDVFKTKRTALDCKTRWLGDKLPDIDHSDWNSDEVERLKQIVASQDGPINWVQIAEALGTHRSPIDCLRHSLERRTNWTDELDDKLNKAVDLYGKDWNLVARAVADDLTAQGCEYRYERVLSDSMKRSAWTPEEDARLALAVAGYGDSWVEVAAAMPGRVNDQCRDRWNDIKTRTNSEQKWTEEEDAKLLKAFEKHGPQWKTISAEIGSHWTDKQCRKRYQTLQRRAQARASETFDDREVPPEPRTQSSSAPRPRLRPIRGTGLNSGQTEDGASTSKEKQKEAVAVVPRAEELPKRAHKRQRIVIGDQDESPTVTSSPRRTSSRLAKRTRSTALPS